jgi:cobalt-zinc-cadmium efflux system protein
MHDHNHHHHGHHHSGHDSQKMLGIAFFITAAYMVAEVIGGILFNSLALLADAGHMITDATALGLSWIAAYIGKRPATKTHTFGFKRTEILAALLNGLVLWGIVGVIFYEAVRRFMDPPEVQGVGMLSIAVIGLLVNLIMAALLFRGRTESLNVKGAFLHVLSDALGSAGAIAAALIIIFTGFNRADAIVSFFVGLLVLKASWGLVRESVRILLEAVPADIDITEVEQALTQHPDVCCVYELHVWSITSNQAALSAHVVLSEDPEEGASGVLENLTRMLREEFHIGHSTIQLEASHEMRNEGHFPYCRAGTVCDTGVCVATDHDHAHHH